MSGQATASWYPDPSGRYQFRYWDGRQWTQHVTSGGRPDVDPLGVGPPAAVADRKTKKIQRAVQRSGVIARGRPADRALLEEPVLVVSQKAKVVEINADYAVYDQHGNQIGFVREVGQSLMKKAVALRSDHNRSYRLLVLDAHGAVLLSLTRPAKVVRSKMIVRDAGGAEIGEIAQKNLGVIGKIRFGLESSGRSLGSIHAENWKAWDFSIRDDGGTEIARITKSWAGLAKEMFTKADNYVVHIQRPLDEPLRSLVVAASLAIDTALKQGDNRSGGRSRIR